MELKEMGEQGYLEAFPPNGGSFRCIHQQSLPLSAA